jgi:hypothetical protein
MPDGFSLRPFGVEPRGQPGPLFRRQPMGLRRPVGRRQPERDAEHDGWHGFQDEQPLPARTPSQPSRSSSTPDTSDPMMCDSGIAAMNTPTMRER